MRTLQQCNESLYLLDAIVIHKMVFGIELLYLTKDNDTCKFEL